MAEEIETKDRWKYRRRVTVFGIGFLSSLILALVLVGSPENKLHELALEDMIWAWVAIIGMYIGAPVADDWLQTRKARVS